MPPIIEYTNDTEATIAVSAEVDNLALQIALHGAQACSAKGLKPLLELAGKYALTDLAEAVQTAKERQQKKKLSDKDANDLIASVQLMLLPPVVEPVVEAAPQAVDPGLQAFAEDPELLADFVMEADEHLATIEEKILVLEKDSSLIELIHAVFRSFHSIKGLAGFLGLTGVQTVAHEVETLLDHARNLRIAVTPQIVDLVLDSSEYLKDEIEVVRAKLAGTELPSVRDNKELIRILSTATSDIAAGRPFLTDSTSRAVQKEVTPTPLATDQVDEAPIQEASVEETSIEESPIDEARFEEAETPGVVVSIAPEPVFAATPPTAAPSKTLSLVSSPKVIREETTNETPGAPPSDRQPRLEAASTSIRVETAKLDRLMDMVGEMVIAQSILSNIPRSGSTADARIAGEMSQLARITSEVQRCAMSMRMMPIGPLFQKNAKMVRDLSRRNGKKVSLELIGETTELDKSIAEELSDPLLHMIRNALDHGIETPDQRIAAGKSEIASLRIAAEHAAGQIVISISDDGRGLDPVKIRNKAIQNKLIEEAEQLSEAEIFHLIFAPGFSTAEKITDISGRGVGMDVVRQHVESLRGRIEIRSKLGEGTTFLIHLPLTLAIIEGLVIVVGEHRYIIPLYSVREMLRPTQDMLFTVKGADEVILMRGSLLPLVRLHTRFGITPRTNDICEGLLVVCEFAGKRYCLFVDDLLGRQEVVIKSLDEAFRKVRGVVGSAILGDGRIGLILDVAGVFNSDSQELQAVQA